MSSKMRRWASVIACALAAFAASPGSAGAEPSSRACVGGFVSGFAQAAVGVGHVVSGEAQTIQPFGAIVISPFATTCEFVGGGG